MGREVKRVPVDFNWPLHKVWEGFLLPQRLHELPCEACRYPGSHGSTGYSPESYAVHATFYPHMIGSGSRARDDALAWHDKLGQAEVDYLVAEGCLRELRRREPTPDRPRESEWVSVPRSAAEVNAAQQGGRMAGMSHDGINHMLLVRFRCERLGIPIECPVCQGHASLEAYPGQRTEAEAWEHTEPPEGEGWQIWETVSEGSPVSPVFNSPERLAQWMTTPDAGLVQTTYDVAMKFIRAGWAPSLVSSAKTGVISGVEWVGRTQKD